MIGLQEWIHKFEVGEGARVIRTGAAVLSLLGLLAVYDVREYRNFSTAEAMDTAQLARNMAEGKGYTTLFVRPLSLGLVEAQQMKLKQRTNDFALLKSGHPDLGNPPVYPFLISCLMRAAPWNYRIAQQNVSRTNWLFRYQPEEIICFFNQFLFLGLILMTFLVARRLFDASVAWISALVLAGSDVYWRFSVSGLSTILLAMIFLGVVWCLALMEQAAREATRGKMWFVAMGLLVGAMVGLGALTRYAFGWMILPVIVFFGVYLAPRRTLMCLVGALAFLAVVSPWLARNHHWSGTWFGTAGYSVLAGTPPFPENELERTLQPDLSAAKLGDCIRKLIVNTGEIFQNQLPKLGGSWITAFFLVGLMVPFVGKSLGRLRIFLVISLLILTAVQALGRTRLTDDSPEINSENLLVLLVPLVFIFGAGMYFLLLDQLDLPFPQLRQLLTGVFVLACCAPIVFRLLPPRALPLAYPPYYPPWIQQFGGWMDEKELVMSDMPWAMAWYGRRQSVWTTLKVQDRQGREDFFAISELRKSIHAIYLTSLSLDARFHSQMLRAREGTWERFLLESLATTNGLPAGFPLKHVPTNPYLGSGQFFLTDWLRWNGQKEQNR